MSTNTKVPSALVPLRVFESAGFLSDSARLLLFDGMIGFVKDGELSGFDGVDDPKERATLMMLFEDFTNEVGRGVEKYREKQLSGTKGQLKRLFKDTLELGTERDFERLWVANGSEPNAVRAKIAELAGSSVAGSSSTLRAPSYN